MVPTDIIFHNVSGSMNVVTELLKSSLKLKPKIISLTECAFENRDWMNFKGFTCYANPTAERCGCAIYIQNEYVNMFAVSLVSTQYVWLWTAGTEITFGYQRSSTESWDSKNDWHRGSENIIIGDRNAKHRELSHGRNHYGLKMRRWIEEIGMQVCNPFMVMLPPYHQRREGTTIDVVVTRVGRPCKVNTMDIATADHKALRIKTDQT